MDKNFDERTALSVVVLFGHFWVVTVVVVFCITTGQWNGKWSYSCHQICNHKGGGIFLFFLYIMVGLVVGHVELFLRILSNSLDQTTMLSSQSGIPVNALKVQVKLTAFLSDSNNTPTLFLTTSNYFHPKRPKDCIDRSQLVDDCSYS